MFSIIIPTLNEEKYLPILLEDLANQTYKNFEIIIVDAQSTDKTVRVAESFEKKLPLNILISKVKNPGLQRNLGAKMSKNEWLLFVDADNQLDADILSKISKKLTKNDLDFFSAHTKPFPGKLVYKAVLFIGSWYISLMQKTSKPFVNEGFFGCKRKSFLAIGGFPPQIKVNEGSLLLEVAYKKGFHYKVFSDVYFTQHMRRVEKNGTWTTAMRFMQVLTHHVLNKPLPETKLTEIYPMDDRFR